jgi:hypothetical protein
VAIKKIISKAKKEEAKANTTVSKKVHNDKNKLEEQVVKQGVPKEHSVNHNIDKTFNVRTAGVAVGVTKSLDNYESLRADCWLTDVIQEDETQEEAIARLMAVASQTLIEQVEELMS